jgi:hypothetical protein
MKPYASYLFEKLRPDGVRFIMREHKGDNIPDFPPMWFPKYVPHSETGVKYTEIKVEKRHHQIIHSLLFGDDMYIDINSLLSFPCLYYGDFKEDAFLIQFREGYLWHDFLVEDWFNIWFFKNMKQQAEMLYYQWISGELILENEINKYIFKNRYPWLSKRIVTSEKENIK